MKPVTIKGLAPNEAAFELDSGDTIIVTLTRRADAQPGFVLLQVDTTVIDPKRLSVRYVLQHHEASYQLAALTAPNAMAEMIAGEYVAASERAAKFMAAQAVLVDLPMIKTPGKPVIPSVVSPAKPEGG